MDYRNEQYRADSRFSGYHGPDRMASQELESLQSQAQTFLSSCNGYNSQPNPVPNPNPAPSLTPKNMSHMNMNSFPPGNHQNQRGHGVSPTIHANVNAVDTRALANSIWAQRAMSGRYGNGVHTGVIQVLF